MENFVGLLYNSGATQEGVGYKNGFGSVYAISGANVIDRCAIFLNGFNNEKILETEGFIFWARFNILNLSTGGTNLNAGYFFTTDGLSYYSITQSSFTVTFEASGIQPPYMSLNLGGSSWSSIPYRDLIPGVTESNVRIVPSTASTGISSFNLLVYKEPSKNFNQISAFTTYMNNYKKVHPSAVYGLPFIYLNNIKFLYKGGFGGAIQAMGMNMNVHNFGMAKTTMTPTEFELFAQKMYKYDNYWHLFEGETDTPNINQSDILFYIPMYQKFGGNSSSSTINLTYPKLTTKYAYTTTENTPDAGAGLAKLNLKLGPLNRWRRPYPPYEPYI